MAHAFKRNRLGKTNIEVSELGLGTASLAGNMAPVPIQDASATVQHALENGINYVDTAPFYGFGKSEHLVGDAIRDTRENVVLSTKAGRILEPHFGDYTVPHSWRDHYPFVDRFDFTYDAIMRSHAESLQRLGTNRIDILFIHDIASDTLGDQTDAQLKVLETSGYRALEELKSSGQIGAIGIGVNVWEVLERALDFGDWDAFLVAGRYTLLEQNSLDPLLSKCVKRGTSIIDGGPFNSGILVGGTTWNYERAPEHLLEKVAKIEKICQAYDVVLPAAALQFPNAHPAVACTLPGPRTVTELDQNMDWFRQSIPAEFWETLATSGLMRPGTPLPGGVVAS